MLFIIAIIIFLSGSCDAKININITLTSSKASTIIKYAGYDDKKTTLQEVNLFNITDENLKRGFKKELGRTPDEVFLKDPTTNGDIFQQFNWTSAYRSIRISKIKIVDIINENIKVHVTKLHNKADDVSKVPYGTIEIVENMVNSTWSTHGLPRDYLDYDLNIKYGLTNNSIVRKWRQNKPDYISSLFGINNAGVIIMKPEDVILKELSGKRTVLVLNVTYTASLLGRVVGSYGEVYGHYHFWAPSVGDIMKAANLSNKIETTELMEVVWHTDPEIVVMNDVTKELVLPYFHDKPYRATDRNTKLRLKKPKKVKEKKILETPQNKGKESDDECLPKPQKDSKAKQYRVFPPKSQWRIVRVRR